MGSENGFFLHPNKSRVQKKTIQDGFNSNPNGSFFNPNGFFSNPKSLLGLEKNRFGVERFFFQP